MLVVIPSPVRNAARMRRARWPARHQHHPQQAARVCACVRVSVCACVARHGFAINTAPFPGISPCFARKFRYADSPAVSTAAPEIRELCSIFYFFTARFCLSGGRTFTLAGVARQIPPLFCPHSSRAPRPCLASRPVSRSPIGRVVTE